MAFADLIPLSQNVPVPQYAWAALAIVFGLTVLLSYPAWKWFRMKRYLKKIPGAYDALPFVWIYRAHKFMVSNSCKVDYNVNLLSFTLGLAKQFPKKSVIKAVFGLQPFIGLTSFKSAEKVLSSSTLLEKRLVYEMLQPWLGTGLLTSNGAKWKSRRRMLTPAFHFRILDDFLPVMNEHSQVFVQKLRSASDRDWVEAISFTSRCTLDIICETAMGVKMNTQSEENSEYIQSLKFVGQKLFSRVPRVWTWIDSIYFLTSEGRKVKKAIGYLHKFTDEVIKQRKTEFMADEERLKAIRENASDDGFSAKSGKRKAFLDLLLTQHYLDSSFTEKDMREEVDTFMFEGHDTTAMGISWTLYLLGLYPEVQKKLHEELDEVFGEDRDRPVTVEDMKNLKYLECVIKESQRLFPPVPVIARHMVDDVEIDGHIVPKESFCLIPIILIHRDDSVYSKPDEFIPERFQPENSAGRSPYAFIPFSAGPRNCIGQRFAQNEERIVLSHVLRNFTLTSLDPQDKLELAAELVLIPKNGLRVKFTPRS